jgi:hypothetical protein
VPVCISVGSSAAGVIEEGRGALAEERNLVQADAWMHG